MISYDTGNFAQYPLYNLNSRKSSLPINYFATRTIKKKFSTSVDNEAKDVKTEEPEILKFELPEEKKAERKRDFTPLFGFLAGTSLFLGKRLIKISHWKGSWIQQGKADEFSTVVTDGHQGTELTIVEMV